ncbi:MAG: type II secretion system protein GspD [Planctomycetes bacterium]|nr:type II secretion system protein GspD [Planctomycetota bacterium]MBL7142847.1 type II secretion system protein GspD [Phycisphaerae bacterium]
MNKPKYTKKIFLFIILTICTGYSPTQSQPTLDAQKITQEVGRENPFAQIPRSVKTVTPIALQSSELIEEVPELFVQTIMLKFLDAQSLKQAIDKMSSRLGTIAINEKNNSLIVCDTKEQLEKIISEIKKADKTPRQIMVEMVIVDVQLSDDTAIGINWDLLTDKVQDMTYRQNFTTRLGTTIENTANIGDATAFNTTGLGSDFSVINGDIRNVVSMLQQKKDVEILASPRIMVVSGKTASIEAVRELPYNEVTDTSAGGSMSSTEFKKVGVTLNVTATLTDDNLIFLNVNSEQNVVVGESLTAVPIIDTRNAKSEVLLQDGQVVIIGGLRRQELTKETNQVPILGDIPLIGLLFRYTNTVVNNTELIIFLSPRIYKDEEPIPADAMEKFREIKDRPMPSLKKTGDDKK